MEVSSIFPTPIIRDRIAIEATIRTFLNAQPMRANNNNYISRYGLFSEDTHILGNPQCASLKEAILTRAEQIMREQLCIAFTAAKITQSWVSLKKPGGGHERHNHTNSVLSGVYYYDDMEDYAPIRFWREKLSNTYQIELEIDQQRAAHSAFAWDFYWIKPQKNDILFFPSYLYHSVDPNQSNRERKTLAFNIIPKEGLGRKNGLDWLPFDQ